MDESDKNAEGPDTLDPSEPNTDENPVNESEEVEDKTVEDRAGMQQRIPTQIVRAVKALETGRKIKVLEQELTATQVYEPDEDQPLPIPPLADSEPSFTKSWPIRIGLTIMVVGVFSAWLRYQAEDEPQASALGVSASPIEVAAPPEPKRSVPVPSTVPPTEDSAKEAEALDEVKPVIAKPEKRRRPRTRKSNSRSKRVRRNSASKEVSEKLVIPQPKPANSNAGSVPNLPPLPAKKPSADPVKPKPAVANMARLSLLGPAGATIQIDMAKVGELPLPEIALPPGRHSIWAELKGHEVQMIDVDIKAGERRELKIVLRPIPKATF